MTQPRLLGGRYELDGIVGRGGMAEVFRARDIRLDRVVGVKTLRDDLARDQTFQARFRREAQSAASLNHPSIVAVYDTGEDMVGNLPVPYIVMEFVDGRTLRDLLKDNRRLLPERALEITDGVLRALDYSHRNGIVHRDIKPGNVMLTRSGEVKVMDFGIARAVADSQLTMTQTAQVIGTAQYLSPEQARGERVDARSDLYSTGCLLYELLTGRPPFTGDSPVAIAYQHVKEEPIPPSQIDPEVPAWADAIVLKAMRKDPADRYQSAGEMRNDIQRALAGAPLAAPMPAAYGAGTRRMGVAGTQVAGRTTAIPPYQYGPPGYGPDGMGPDGEPKRHRVWPWVALATVVVVLIAVIVLLKFIGSANTGVAVPNVVGESLSTAERSLVDDGFQIGTKTARTSSSETQGNVISTSPGFGATEPKGTKIDIVYSSGSGSKDVSVPNVVGSTQTNATNALEQAGFKVRVVSGQQAGAQAGTVISQSPAANTPRPSGSTVTITVTPTSETVPNVIGDSQAAATNELTGAPWDYNVTVTPGQGPGTYQPGTVYSTSPGPGQALPPDGNITIYVQQAATPSPAPSTASPSPSPSPS
jgi:eukaryotic-like serine/threonine-protein kinase